LYEAAFSATSTSHMKHTDIENAKNYKIVINCTQHCQFHPTLLTATLHTGFGHTELTHS